MLLTRRLLGPVAIGAALAALGPCGADAASPAAIDQGVDRALRQLTAHNKLAAALSKTAVAVLVFPKIVKGGLLVGGAYGEGALRKRGRSVGYYVSTAASYGLQAGMQSFGYALFFMNESALAYLDKSGGFDVGVGPSLVVADSGFAKKETAAGITQEIVAFIFGQSGYMAGAGIEGSKITRLK